MCLSKRACAAPVQQLFVHKVFCAAPGFAEYAKHCLEHAQHVLKTFCSTRMLSMHRIYFGHMLAQFAAKSNRSIFTIFITIMYISPKE
jgi:hypothetical protein